jgi:hypothetical protein
MNAKTRYALKLFERAGFKLLAARVDDFRYESSPIDIHYLPNWDEPIRIFMKGSRGRQDFTSPARALRFIRGRLSMQVVGGNEWALNTGRRGQLRLVESHVA